MIDEDTDDAVDPRGDEFLKKLARVDDLPPPEGELRTGDRLARFVIVKRLGTGGMGAVYEAKDETLGRAVALKIMRRASDEARRRFIQEARAAAAVSHPNLIVVHEVGEADGRAFIVMELIRGRTLRGVMADAVARDEALRILRGVAHGLAAAHAAGIVHRDLKPENVMLTGDGTVKVLDFGVARLSHGDGARAVTALAVTGTGVVVGTPQYMSPEQALGVTVDARSDIYSFGVLAYELLTGTRPEPNPPPATVSPQLDGVLARCLAADPRQRYADARELTAALEGRARSRRSWPWIIAAAIAVLAIAGALWWHAHRDRAPMVRVLGASPTVKAANQDAINAYRGAFQQLRDDMYFEAVSSFEHATELDPTFAAAHLRLGIFKRYFHSAEEARQSYQIAVKNRDQLDERDRALLYAAEPFVARDPYDYAEGKRRLGALLARYPDDVEILYYYGSAISELGEHAETLPLADHMKDLDPTAAAVWGWRSFTLLYLGDRSAARESAIECKRLAPLESSCAFELSKILNDTGSCTELETVLRAWKIASPDSPKAPRDLARLLISVGRPLDAAHEMNAEARQRTPEPARAELDAEERRDLAFYTGDFVTLEQQLRAWLEPWNANVAAELIDVLEETGRGDEARAIAERFFAVGDAGFVPKGSSDADLYNDQTGIMLATLARHGAITHDELTRRRDAWVHELDRRIGGDYKLGIWAQAYANTTRTPEEAADAVAVAPSRQAPFYWFTATYGGIGRTFAMANRPEDALPYLLRATQRCFDRDPRDFYYLGLAQEETGDARAACGSYRQLITRWHDARPRSVTLEQAQARASALHCSDTDPVGVHDANLR